MSKWNVEKQFYFADLWYHLHLGRISDYFHDVLDRFPKRMKYLGKDGLLRFYFYTNIRRRHYIDFECEHILSELRNELTMDEWCVVAMGYFKSQTKIKLTSIVKTMINSVKTNSKTINNITLTAILKTVRFSQKSEVVSDIIDMLDALTEEIPRLSLLACLHMTLIGTTLQFYHENSLNKCCQKLLDNIDKIRLKDIERILLATTMFNFNPKTTIDFYPAMLQELRKDSRLAEFLNYQKCLPLSLHFLSIHGIYDYELTSKILDREFITNVYGKLSKQFPMEILSLDVSLEIECPNYKGNKLLPVIRQKVAKWLLEFAPNYNQTKSLTTADKLFLNIIDHIKKITNYYHIDHILPHFTRPDIILCKDEISDKFIEPIGFNNYEFGDIKVPTFENGKKWLVLIILVPNITIRNNQQPLGTQIMKYRQLKILGFHPKFINWMEYTYLKTEDEKINYLNNKLNDGN